MPQFRSEKDHPLLCASPKALLCLLELEASACLMAGKSPHAMAAMVVSCHGCFHTLWAALPLRVDQPLRIQLETLPLNQVILDETYLGPNRLQTQRIHHADCRTFPWTFSHKSPLCCFSLPYTQQLYGISPPDMFTPTPNLPGVARHNSSETRDRRSFLCSSKDVPISCSLVLTRARRPAAGKGMGMGLTSQKSDGSQEKHSLTSRIGQNLWVWGR